MMYIVYTKNNCKFCILAKNLLQSKKILFNEIKIDVDGPREPNHQYITLTDLKIKFPGIKTAPVVTKDGILVGGYTELALLV